MPTTVLASEEWQLLLSRLTDALGGDDFCRVLADACQFLAGYESTIVMIYAKDKRPLLIFQNLDTASMAHYQRTPYFEAEYLFDPFYSLYENNAPDGIYRLEDIAPDSFFDSAYYKLYYQQTNLSDETGIFFKLNDELHILIDMANRGSPKAGEHRIQKLQMSLPVLISLCRKHEKLRGETAQSNPEAQWTFSVSLDRAFKNFGKDYLSKRECEVIQLIFKGHSNKSIARLLEISVDTVKFYNKRFHQKLDISSQAELFSLFLETIAMVPIDSDEDPLTHYFEITRQKSARSE